MIKPAKFHQIIQNLVKNSAEAYDSQQTEKWIKITVDHSKEKGFIQIALHDNGKGIPKDAIEKVFQYGYTTKSDGSGFGLHSVALAVKEMDGKIGIKSEGQGHGTTVTLDFPLA